MNKKPCLSEVNLSDCILLHPKCRERAKRTISIMRKWRDAAKQTVYERV